MSDAMESRKRAGHLDVQAVAKVRHDLRNPLGHIMGFGELLLERARQAQRSEAAPGLEELVSASEQILDEINHSLDPRRLEAGQVNLSKLQADVRRFCRRAIELGQQAERRMGGDEKVREDVRRITSSAERMELLGNASIPVLQRALALPEAEEIPADSPARRSGREIIGLMCGESEEQRQWLQTLRASGYQVQWLGSRHGAPVVEDDSALDVLLVELDLEQDEELRFLEDLRGQAATTRWPVMVLARAPSEAAVRRALQAGAHDVVRYPLPSELLLARMESILAIKRLHDQERALLRRIATEQQQTDQLVQSLLPPSIAARLRRGERLIADLYPEASVLAADFGGLSRWSGDFAPEAIVRGLNEVFAAYDTLCQKFSVPVGRLSADSYQVMMGGPDPAGDCMELAAELALAMQREALPLRLAGGRLFRVRIGVHSGPVCVGVLGGDRMCFEVWGETVDLARALRGQASPGGILMSGASASLLEGRYVFELAPSLRLDPTKEFETRLLLGKVPTSV